MELEIVLSWSFPICHCTESKWLGERVSQAKTAGGGKLCDHWPGWYKGKRAFQWGLSWGCAVLVRTCRHGLPQGNCCDNTRLHEVDMRFSLEHVFSDVRRTCILPILLEHPMYREVSWGLEQPGKQHVSLACSFIFLIQISKKMASLDFSSASQCMDFCHALASHQKPSPSRSPLAPPLRSPWTPRRSWPQLPRLWRGGRALLQ